MLFINDVLSDEKVPSAFGRRRLESKAWAGTSGEKARMLLRKLRRQPSLRGADRAGGGSLAGCPLLFRPPHLPPVKPVRDFTGPTFREVGIAGENPSGPAAAYSRCAPVDLSMARERPYRSGDAERLEVREASRSTPRIPTSLTFRLPTNQSGRSGFVFDLLRCGAQTVSTVFLSLRNRSCRRTDSSPTKPWRSSLRPTLWH